MARDPAIHSKVTARLARWKWRQPARWTRSPKSHGERLEPIQSRSAPGDAITRRLRRLHRRRDVPAGRPPRLDARVDVPRGLLRADDSEPRLPASHEPR